MAGTFPDRWIHGAPGCAHNPDPPIQVHAFDANTVIMRESKCANPGTPANPGASFEAPFMYLLFGDTMALLVDSGDTASPALLPIAATVRAQINARLAVSGRASIRLAVCHSHAHGDHVMGDGQFRNESAVAPAARAHVVPLDLNSVKAFFQIPSWPDGRGTLDLGNRVLDVIPIPGHEEHHIALYDRNTRLLLTGDTLYPGLLFVSDFNAYRASVNRLAAFVEDHHPLSHVLGAHVEMKRARGKFFGYPHPFFQPDEHALQLEERHVFELRDAVSAMTAALGMVRRDDFIVFHDREENMPREDP